MESKLVEYARAVVEDAVDVDADFFQKYSYKIGII